LAHSFGKVAIEKECPTFSLASSKITRRKADLKDASILAAVALPISWAR